jgi:hypothetical protein
MSAGKCFRNSLVSNIFRNTNEKESVPRISVRSEILLNIKLLGSQTIKYWAVLEKYFLGFETVISLIIIKIKFLGSHAMKYFVCI